MEVQRSQQFQIPCPTHDCSGKTIFDANLKLLWGSFLFFFWKGIVGIKRSCVQTAQSNNTPAVASTHCSNRRGCPGRGNLQNMPDCGPLLESPNPEAPNDQSGTPTPSWAEVAPSRDGGGCLSGGQSFAPVPPGSFQATSSWHMTYVCSIWPWMSTFCELRRTPVNFWGKPDWFRHDKGICRK